MAVDTLFPPGSPEEVFLSREINNEIQTLAQGPTAAEVSAEKLALQAAMDSQEAAAADYVKNAGPQTRPSRIGVRP